MATLCMKNIEQTQKIQEGKQTKKKKKTNPQINYREKRANERRERITSRESPSSRPVKKHSTKRSKHLITGIIQILKSPPIPFLPNTPKNAQHN